MRIDCDAAYDGFVLVHLIQEVSQIQVVLLLNLFPLSWPTNFSLNLNLLALAHARLDLLHLDIRIGGACR